MLITADTTAPTVNVTWSYAKAADGVDADNDSVDYTEAPADVAPSLVGDSFTMTAGQPFEITVDFGKGDLKATEIDSVSFERSGSDVTVGTDKYTVAGNKITFISSWVDAQLNSITTSRTYKIVFDDTAKTEVTFTITK